MRDTAELELVPAAEAETPTKQLAPYNEFEVNLKGLLATAETISVTSSGDKAKMTLARATRLELKKVRVAITNRHKELKESILVEGRKIDHGKNELLKLIEPQEERLLECEQFAEREAERIATEKRAFRVKEISPFLTGPLAVDVGTVTDEVYAAMLEDAKAADAARKAKIDADRQATIAKAKAEAEERERVRQENERLRKEAAEQAEQARKEREAHAAETKRLRDEEAERQRIADEAAKKEREAHAAALAKAREESDRIAREEKVKADAEANRIREEAAEIRRVADEKARKERAEIEAKAKADREAREKIEAEVAKQKAADEAATESKRVAEEAAKAAPDKEKLTALAKTVRAIEVPLLSTEKGELAANEIIAKIEAFAAWIEKKAASL